MTAALMFQGTGSDVGKTVLVAGLCRLMANRGLTTRPFKPQNMSNNAAVADDGGEIGRAQWLQALACRVPSSVHMNPVLLKPQTETGSQIVVQGKVWGRAAGRDYQKYKPDLMNAVMESYTRMAREADIVLIEGAGSPAEINLRSGDIANMGFARQANVPVVIVADIDRGGVIASLVGTHAVLDPVDRAMVSGYLINKFRGDVDLFAEGTSAIGRFTGWPSFGIVPWLAAAGRLPAEDSVALERLARNENGGLRIAVPMVSRIANFDDFDALKAEPDVDMIFVRPGERIPADAALVILPGSKSTIADLADLRACGWDKDLAAHHARGGRIIGICGGFQMLGRRISDPKKIEGSVPEIEGLGLLDIQTELAAEKTVRNVVAQTIKGKLPLEGYEIHLGVTHGPDCARPFSTINGHADGAVSADGQVMGTYLHRVFDSDAYRSSLLGEFGIGGGDANYRAQVEESLDKIAEELGRYLDIEAMLKIARA